MYGLPEQSILSWQDTISKILTLNIQHVSAYHLTYEAGTLLARKQKKGEVQAIEEEDSRKMYDILLEMLGSAGIRQYEISNFALPGMHSRHNSSYWEYIPYLGIGPSAHSFDMDTRQWNIANIDRYMEGIQAGLPCYDTESLSLEDKYNELIMISLRTTKGLSLSQVSKLCGTDMTKALLNKAERYIKSGLMILKDEYLIFTSDGFFLSDGIMLDFMHD